MTKKLSLIALILAMAVTFCAAPVYADMHKRSMHKGKYGYGRKMGLEEKFLYKAHMMLMNKDELGLSDRQADQIKKLKVSVKKDIISKKAQIDVLKVDINSEMWEDPMDLNAINPLIEKKYELKKEKSQALVAAMAKLKGILTDKQKETLKELCEKKKD